MIRILDMRQFDGDQYESIKMDHLSCSLDAVWAREQSGHVRMGLASLEPFGLSSAWTRLDDQGESSGNRANAAISEPVEPVDFVVFLGQFASGLVDELGQVVRIAQFQFGYQMYVPSSRVTLEMVMNFFD